MSNQYHLVAFAAGGGSKAILQGDGSNLFEAQIIYETEF